MSQKSTSQNDPPVTLKRDGVAGFVSHPVVDFALHVAALGGLWFCYNLVRQYTADEFFSAVSNSANVVNWQQAVGLPHEGSMQVFLLDNPVLVRAANTFYMTAHFPITAAFMLWAWARHRSAFPVIRTTIVSVTAVGLFLHLVFPLAPPRMMPGFFDTGALFGPSPYSVEASAAANQIAAMPSLHVGWAVIVALSIISLSRSPWRFLAIIHPVLTMAVVLLTANHYWFDGIVATALVAGGWTFAVRHEGRHFFSIEPALASPEPQAPNSPEPQAPNNTEPPAPTSPEPQAQLVTS